MAPLWREPDPAAAPAGARKLPANPDEIRNHFIRKVVRLAAWMMVPVMLGFAAAYAMRGQWLLMVAELVGSLMIALSYLSTRRQEDPLVGLQMMAASAWLMLAIVIFMHGGLRSPAVLWMAMLAPLIFLAGAPRALWFAAASMAFIAALYVIEQMGWMPAYADVPLGQRVVSAALIILLFVVFARNALQWRNGIAAELMEARDAALEANRLKSRFIANLNHELRTPLNTILGSAQLLARAPDASNREQLLDALRTSANHLLQLVNDVLDHSRLEAGGTALEDLPFDLPALLRDVTRMLGPSVQAKQLTLTLELDPALPAHCQGDATRIRQVLVNLVSNAVKFTQRGGIVLRAQRSGTESAPQLQLIVDDSGPGMSAAARANVFEPYVQEDASISRRHGGTGLGLAICRDLVHLMQGRIEAQPAPGGGARFVVELPLRTAAAGAADPTPVEPPAEAAALPASVLLVEDNPVNLLVTEAMLRQIGAQVVTADSGPQALARMAEASFDVVLMDLQMPGMDGLTAARQRRSEEASHGWPRQRLVALTGEVEDGARAACAAAGMDGFLSKPVALDDLAAVLVAARPASA